MKPALADIIIVFLAVAAVTLFTVTTYGGQGGVSLVHIKTADSHLVYSMTDSRILSVQGQQGSTTIVVDENGARITTSACSRKLCIRKGTISGEGEWIACLPNGVFVYIQGGSNAPGIDALSQ